uniref:Uncharacterized protein n=1 Tax=Caudovirales sp. ctCpR1 TaxID=2825760 RepID=A0A8S5V925_9CAUD|nr:MAG TPA: hypothetical protein [Caudovirales sp. ctCpR1]
MPPPCPHEDRRGWACEKRAQASSLPWPYAGKFYGTWHG